MVVGGAQIPTVNHLKFLGVIFDSLNRKPLQLHTNCEITRGSLPCSGVSTMLLQCVQYRRMIPGGLILKPVKFRFMTCLIHAETTVFLAQLMLEESNLCSECGQGAHDTPTSMSLWSHPIEVAQFLKLDLHPSWS